MEINLMKRYNFVRWLWRKLRQEDRIKALGWRVRRAERQRDHAKNWYHKINTEYNTLKKEFRTLVLEVAKSQHRQMIDSTQIKMPGPIKTPYHD